MATQEKPQTLSITVTQHVPLKRVSDLLCSAIEGGSNYWYTIEKFNKPPKLVFRTDAKTIFRHLDYPLNEGGSLIIMSHGDGDHSDGDEVNGKTRWTLDLPACQRGLQLMAEKYPSHFGDFIAENDDAITADVFLQCCLFGEIIYG